MVQLNYLLLTLFSTVFLVCGAPLKLCQRNEYAEGRWVYNNMTRQFNQYSNSLQDLPGEDHAKICCKSKRTTNYVVYPAVCSKTQQNYREDEFGEPCCVCSFNDEVDGDVYETMRWEWVPSNCHLLNFEAVPFCHALGDRTMLMIGDSMTRDTWERFLYLVRSGGGACHKQLTYGRSFYLHFPKGSSDHTFDHYVNAVNPDIVIMNAGAHLNLPHEMRDEILALVLPKIKALEEKTAAEHPERRKREYFFRTQYGGHPSCMNYTRPLLNYSAHEGPYNWHHFPQYDADVKELLANSTLMKVLDASPLYMRADAHKASTDCLHYAQFGALDVIARFIYQLVYTGYM